MPPAGPASGVLAPAGPAPNGPTRGVLLPTGADPVNRTLPFASPPGDVTTNVVVDKAPVSILKLMIDVFVAKPPPKELDDKALLAAAPELDDP